MANQISRTYRNPVWEDITTKDKIICEILVNLDDGTTQVLNASISGGEENSDWVALFEKFTPEQVDEASTEEVLARNKRREEDRIRNEEESKRRELFQKQEALFASKLEAFEIEAVKNSKNRTLKAQIRKSKTLMEVQAYTTILLMKELDNATQATEPPPAE